MFSEKCWKGLSIIGIKSENEGSVTHAYLYERTQNDKLVPCGANKNKNTIISTIKIREN